MMDFSFLIIFFFVSQYLDRFVFVINAIMHKDPICQFAYYINFWLYGFDLHIFKAIDVKVNNFYPVAL